MANRTTIKISGDDVLVLPKGMDRVWSCRKRVTFPVRSVRGVRIERSPFSVATGWRGPGLDFMGKMCGTFHPNGQRHFWNYGGSGDALEITLDDGQEFQKLYLSVSDPVAIRDQLLDAAGEKR